MSSAPMVTNPNKMRHQSNQTRPGGASSLAANQDPRALQLALDTGNRQTRRLALKNIKKLMRTRGNS